MKSFRVFSESTDAHVDCVHSAVENEALTFRENFGYAAHGEQYAAAWENASSYLQNCPGLSEDEFRRILEREYHFKYDPNDWVYMASTGKRNGVAQWYWSYVSSSEYLQAKAQGDIAICSRCETWWADDNDSSECFKCRGWKEAKNLSKHRPIF